MRRARLRDGPGAPLAPAAALRVFLLLTATRWFPVGLVIGVMMLLPLERGLTVGQTVTALGLIGLVVFVLELPTSGFADVFGRRPVLLAAGVVNVAAALAMVLADSFADFAAAAALLGVSRALDSGPLEAWYVDTVHQSEPSAPVDRAMAAHGVVTGLGIAGGSLLAGGLVWWHPWSSQSALLPPFVLWAALGVMHVVALLGLMREPRRGSEEPGARWRRAAASARQAPHVVRSGLGLLRSSPALRGTVLVTVFSALAMVVFESFQPLRLAELLGSEETAGALMGPVAAAGWAAFAAGSALVGRLSRVLGVARSAMVAHLLVAGGAVVMGLTTGPAGLVTAYLLTYGLFGSTAPVHQTLLHREAAPGNRATVLSIDSMAGFAAFGLGAPMLGLLAEVAGLQTAMVSAGVISALGAGCYRASRRAELVRARTPVDLRSSAR